MKVINFSPVDGTLTSSNKIKKPNQIKDNIIKNIEKKNIIWKKIIIPIIIFFALVIIITIVILVKKYTRKIKKTPDESWNIAEETSQLKDNTIKITTLNLDFKEVEALMGLEIVETNYIILNETINNIIESLNNFEKIDIKPINTEINYTSPGNLENPTKASLKLVKSDVEFYKSKFEELSEKSNNISEIILKSIENIYSPLNKTKEEITKVLYKFEEMMRNLSIGSKEPVLCRMPNPDTSRFSTPYDTIPVFESHDVDEMIKACYFLRHILSNEHNPPVQEVVSAGCLPHLIRCISEHENLKLQFEAAWAITNVASSESRFTSLVVQEGGVPPLLNLLTNSPSWEIMEQAVWAIGNIAGDGTTLRDRVVEFGGLDDLIRVAQRTQREEFPNSFIRNFTWTMSNMFRFKPKPHARFMLSAIPVLKNFLSSTDEECVTNTLWSFSYISESDLTEPTSACEIVSSFNLRISKFISILSL